MKYNFLSVHMQQAFDAENTLSFCEVRWCTFREDLTLVQACNTSHKATDLHISAAL